MNLCRNFDKAHRVQRAHIVISKFIQNSHKYIANSFYKCASWVIFSEAISGLMAPVLQIYD